MPANRLPTSPAVGRFLRDQRKRLGFTLRDVEDVSARMGKVIPFSTLSRIEQGALDPGLPRLQQLLRVYHVPLQAAGDLLDLEEMAGELPPERDAKTLFEIGRDASKRGDSRAALAAFLALKLTESRDDPVLRQRALLGLSSTAGSLGKYQFAKHVVEGLLLDSPAPSVLVPALVQYARCWHWLGSYEVALALIERAEARLTRSAPPDVRAYVFHEKASILVDHRRFDGAEAALVKALAAYSRDKNHGGYGRALGVRVRMGFVRGDHAGALAAAHAARLYAQRYRIDRLRLLYTIEEAHAQLALGRAKACLASIGIVLADAVSVGDKVVCFYAHVYGWKAYEALGDAPHASSELDEAIRHLDFIDETTPEVLEVRALVSRGRAPRDGRSRRG